MIEKCPVPFDKQFNVGFMGYEFRDVALEQLVKRVEAEGCEVVHIRDISDYDPDAEVSIHRIDAFCKVKQ